MGSTILTIGLPFFKRLKIAAPTDLQELQAIGECLKTADQQIFALQNELKKTKDIKAGLMQDLLTGKVRVSLDREERTEAVA